MNASMIRFALKSFPQAKELNDSLMRTTLECVPLGFVSIEVGLPVTPGWDMPAYVSNLACALRHDNALGEGVPEFAAYIRKIRCKIDRNCSIQELAIQKQLYNILIGKIPNGWNPLISRRLSDFGVDLACFGPAGMWRYNIHWYRFESYRLLGHSPIQLKSVPMHNNNQHYNHIDASQFNNFKHNKYIKG